MGDDDGSNQEIVPDPSPLLKIWDWCKIVMQTKKMFVMVWSLVFGTGGTAIYGEVTDTTPFRDAAIEIGIIDTKSVALKIEKIHDQVVIPHTHSLQEHDHQLKEHTHPSPEHDHELQMHEHGHGESPSQQRLESLENQVQKWHGTNE